MSHSNLFKLRQRLLWRIGRRYRVITEEVETGGLRFPFTRIADPDRVLDEVAAEADLRDRLRGTPAPGDELHLPYWAELWESARGMGEYLARGDAGIGEADAGTRRRGDAEKASTAASAFPCPGVSVSPSPIPASPRLRVSASPTNVLDLGCGMGMAGTVAAAWGASVVFADLEAPALLFAQLNSLPWRHRVRTRRLNWQRDRLNEKFDLVLGADILYERAQWPFLEPFWRAHLADGGQVLLGEPGRQTGDLFVEWIAAKGWKLVRSEVPVASRPRPIRIYSLTLE